MYGAVAAAAGIGYVGVSSIGSGAPPSVSAGGAHSTAASTGGGRGGSGDGGVTNLTVNVNGFAMSHEGVQDSVVGAVEGYIGRGRTVRGLGRRAA